MSRLYEALTRRNREGQETAGVDWKEMEVETAGTPAEPGAAAGAAAEVETPAAGPCPEVPPPDVSAADGSFGKKTATAVDRQARLLPSATDPVVVEHYRRLRTKILQIRETRPFGSLMVASGSPQEGKTLTALNLAWSFAVLPSFRVLVVDGDLRKGTMGEWLGIDGELAGFSNLIDGSARLAEAVLQSEKVPFSFMVRGNSPSPPAELLTSPRVSRHLAAMKAHFDLVLVDSPPANLLADAHLLAANCEAVLLVARAYSTNTKSFERVVQELDPSKVIGAVLNAGPVPQTRHGYGSYYDGEKA